MKRREEAWGGTRICVEVRGGLPAPCGGRVDKQVGRVEGEAHEREDDVDALARGDKHREDKLRARPWHAREH